MSAARGGAPRRRDPPGELDRERHVVQRTAEALEARGGRLAGARVLVLGVAYERGVDDARESPALRILDLLRARGARAEYHDPLVVRVARRGEPELVSVPLTDEALAGADAVVVATDPPGIDWVRVVARARLVVDTRDACRDVAAWRHKIVKA